MKVPDHSARWEDLEALLAPLYRQAVRTARGLSGSPVDGDDLFQESVIRAFRKIHTLRDRSRFRAWFFAVMLSIHRSRARALFRKRLVSLDRDLPAGFDVEGNDGRRLHAEQLGARRVAHALGRLPAAQREAIVLHYIEGFSVEEIAELQRVSASGVKSRLSRGRKRLRKHYARLGWDKQGNDRPARSSRGEEAVCD